MYVEKKKIQGKEYYYLKESRREDGKVKTKTIAYLGKGNMTESQIKEAILKFSKTKSHGETSTEKFSKQDESFGDIVIIKTEDDEIKGTLFPSIDSSIVIVKLKSGYNIGIEKSKIKEIKKIGKAEAIEFPSVETKQKENLPGISVITTGGTIVSKLDYATGAVKWLSKPGELFAIAPKMLDIVNINKIEVPFTIGSENMLPKNWAQIAEKAAELLNKKENSGIIVTHGTDTLHYTAAALSFMLRNLNKPVVLTYSQRSPDRGSSDALLNLTCSAYAATSNIAEVMLVGHATSNDNFCYALRGTKVRKMHTSRRDTFRPINSLPIARIHEDGKIDLMNSFNKKHEGKVEVDSKFEEKTALIKYYPGADSDILDYYINKGYRGIVIEMVGLGQLATSESEKNWIPMIKKAIDKGIAICAACQTIYGRLDPYVYSTGREINDAGVIYLNDMLPETAYVKLGWVLGHTKKLSEVKEMMLKNYAGEINERIPENSFLY